MKLHYGHRCDLGFVVSSLGLAGGLVAYQHNSIVGATVAFAAFLTGVLVIITAR